VSADFCSYLPSASSTPLLLRFTPSRKPVYMQTLEGSWPGAHRFGDVYCVRFPNSERAVEAEDSMPNRSKNALPDCHFGVFVEFMVMFTAEPLLQATCGSSCNYVTRHTLVRAG